MKRLVLLLAMFFVCFSLNAQKLNEKFLQGNWETEFHNIEFKVTDKKELKITILLKDSKEEIAVVRYRIHDSVLYMETYYAKNNWKSINKIIVMDDNTLVADVYSDSRDLLIYKRK
jgi:hypothetical protein